VCFFFLFASIILVYYFYGFSRFNGFNGFNGFNIYIVAWYRYQHSKAKCYKWSKKLVQLVNTTLLRHFVHIFYHLYKIREIEGVSPNEGCMDQSPFSRISITRGYHYNIHSDTNNFSYSFFV
jgi:hypothetical protein